MLRKETRHDRGATQRVRIAHHHPNINGVCTQDMHLASYQRLDSTDGRACGEVDDPDAECTSHI
jgi:hypothetical protein